MSDLDGRRHHLCGPCPQPSDQEPWLCGGRRGAFSWPPSQPPACAGICGAGRGDVLGAEQPRSLASALIRTTPRKKMHQVTGRAAKREAETSCAVSTCKPSPCFPEPPCPGHSRCHVSPLCLRSRLYTRVPSLLAPLTPQRSAPQSRRPLRGPLGRKNPDPIHRAAPS